MPKPFTLRCFRTLLLLPLLMSYPKVASNDVRYQYLCITLSFIILKFECVPSTRGMLLNFVK